MPLSPLKGCSSLLIYATMVPTRCPHYRDRKDDPVGQNWESLVDPKREDRHDYRVQVSVDSSRVSSGLVMLSPHSCCERLCLMVVPPGFQAHLITKLSVSLSDTWTFLSGCPMEIHK